MGNLPCTLWSFHLGPSMGRWRDNGRAVAKWKAQGERHGRRRAVQVEVVRLQKRVPRITSLATNKKSQLELRDVDTRAARGQVPGLADTNSTMRYNLYESLMHALYVTVALATAPCNSQRSPLQLTLGQRLLGGSRLGREHGRARRAHSLATWRPRTTRSTLASRAVRGSPRLRL